MSVRLVREEMYLERTHEGFIQPASGFNSTTFMLTANSQSNIIIWVRLSSPEDILQVQPQTCFSSCLILSIESKTRGTCTIHTNIQVVLLLGLWSEFFLSQFFPRLEIRWVAYSSIKMQWFNRGPWLFRIYELCAYIERAAYNTDICLFSLSHFLPAAALSTPREWFL